MSTTRLVSFEDVEASNLLFQGLHTWFSANEIVNIWSDDISLAKHITKKWDKTRYNDYQHDIWKFYDSLDNGNRKRLINWYNKKLINFVMHDPLFDDYDGGL